MHPHADRMSPKMELRQTTFLNGDDAVPVPKVTRTIRKANRPLPDKESLLALFGEVLAPLVRQLAEIQVRLDSLAEQVAKPIVKEYYTTVEIAQRLGKRPYTVREWCRLGRVHAEKANFGRGQDEEWRLSHDELTRIQNEGLLPSKDDSRVAPPRRLPK